MAWPTLHAGRKASPNGPGAAVGSRSKGESRSRGMWWDMQPRSRAWPVGRVPATPPLASSPDPIPEPSPRHMNCPAPAGD